MIAIVLVLLIVSLICTYYFREKLISEDADRLASYMLRKGRKHDKSI